MDVIVKSLLTTAQSSQTGGLFKYISDTINGSCYECLLQSSTWKDYYNGIFSRDRNSNFLSAGILLLLLLIFLLLLIAVLVTVFLTWKFQSRDKKLSSVNYVLIMILITVSIFVSVIFPFMTLSQRQYHETSFFQIANKTFHSVELFVNHSLVTSQSKININRIIDEVFTEIVTTIKDIVKTLMKKMKVDKLMANSPALIHNLISVNKSFNDIYHYGERDHQRVSTFVTEVTMLFHILEVSSAKDSNQDNVNTLMRDHKRMVPKLDLKLSSSIFLNKIQDILPKGITLESIKAEIDKILSDFNKIVPESIKDINEQVPLQIILAKKKELFGQMSNQSLYLHRAFVDVSSEIEKYNVHLVRYECFIIIWMSLIHVFHYTVVIAFKIREQYKLRLHICIVLIAFCVVLVAVSAIVIMLILVQTENDVLRYLREGNQSEVFDRIISNQVNFEWRKIRNMILNMSGDFESLLNLPVDLPHLIITNIKQKCRTNNQSLLSILGFDSVFSFEKLNNIPMFKILISTSRDKANNKIAQEIRKLRIPNLDPNFSNMATNALDKLLNEKESEDNLKKINSIFEYFNWTERILDKLERIVSKRERNDRLILNSFVKRIKTQLPVFMEIVKKMSTSFLVIYKNANLSIQAADVLTQSQESSKYINDIPAVQNIFKDIFDRKINDLFRRIFSTVSVFYKKDVLGNVASCSLFVKIFENTSFFSNFNISIMMKLFCVYLETVIFLTILCIFYVYILRIVARS